MGIDLIVSKCAEILKELDNHNEVEKIECLNQIKILLHSISPMQSEPVDCVLWIPTEEVEANDYNPNSVAPPEMRLLEHSIGEDGYTQPVVTWIREDGVREVIDGFHRNAVARKSKEIRARVRGYLPVTSVNRTRTNRGDRIAATIRHNRARGKHKVDDMSKIVQELTKRNWSEKKIGKELGMEPDEVLRLKQITGLAEMFADQEFSEAWEAE
jgi:ParB-like chromosome segregation protein Spo0J